MKFAKLFEMKDGNQLLVRRCQDENEVPQVEFGTCINDIYASSFLSFDDEEKADKCFKKQDLDLVTKIYNGFKEIINED